MLIKPPSGPQPDRLTGVLQGRPTERKTLPQLFEDSTKGKVQAIKGDCAKAYPTRYHPLFDAIQLAYSRHVPLTIRPDHVWITVLQGLSKYVKLCEREVRHLLVNHAGQCELNIELPGFIMGSPDNPWEKAFDRWVEGMDPHLKLGLEALTLDLSCSTPASRAAMGVAIMDGMSPFFQYTGTTLCGFSEIDLKGTAEDWTTMAQAVEIWQEHFAPHGDEHFRKWTTGLRHILNSISRQLESGEPNYRFWGSCFQEHRRGSGGPVVKGWVNFLFPYNTTPNGRAHENSLSLTTVDGEVVSIGGSTTYSSFLGGLSSVPMLWNYYGTYHRMRLTGGFMGIVEDEEGRIQPNAAWAVEYLEETEAPKEELEPEPLPQPTSLAVQIQGVQGSAEFLALLQALVDAGFPPAEKIEHDAIYWYLPKVYTHAGEEPLASLTVRKEGEIRAREIPKGSWRTYRTLEDAKADFPKMLETIREQRPSLFRDQG